MLNVMTRGKENVQHVLILLSLSILVSKAKEKNIARMHTLKRKIKSCVSFVWVFNSCEKMILFCI